MKTWYSCKIKYAKENDEGLLKQVTEAFLVDAISYTEAETRIYSIAEEILSREFVVTQITKTNISEVLKMEEADDWYKSKITYVANDDESGKEIKVTIYYLVCAENVKQAFEFIEEFMSSMLVPYQVPSITKTNIVEVFPFSEEDSTVADQQKDEQAKEEIESYISQDDESED
jgi:hypothetical protein